MADPIRGQVNPAAVSAELDLFLKHLFAKDFELDHLVSSLGKVFRFACRFDRVSSWSCFFPSALLPASAAAPVSHKILRRAGSKHCRNGGHSCTTSGYHQFMERVKTLWTPLRAGSMNTRRRADKIHFSLHRRRHSPHPALILFLSPLPGSRPSPEAVNPAAVAAGFDLLFEHLFAKDLKFNLRGGPLRSRSPAKDRYRPASPRQFPSRIPPVSSSITSKI